jgi:hypothetical protein
VGRLKSCFLKIPKRKNAAPGLKMLFVDGLSRYDEPVKSPIFSLQQAFSEK